VKKKEGEESLRGSDAKDLSAWVGSAGGCTSNGKPALSAKVLIDAVWLAAT